MENKSRFRTRALTEGAILIALAEILSFLPLYKFPDGGAVDLAMLPIILYCVRWGFGPGMIFFKYCLKAALPSAGKAL